jgi:hypothetical protein
MQVGSVCSRKRDSVQSIAELPAEVVGLGTEQTPIKSRPRGGTANQRSSICPSRQTIHFIAPAAVDVPRVCEMSLLMMRKTSNVTMYFSAAAAKHDQCLVFHVVPAT